MSHLRCSYRELAASEQSLLGSMRLAPDINGCRRPSRRALQQGLPLLLREALPYRRGLVPCVLVIWSDRWVGWLLSCLDRILLDPVVELVQLLQSGPIAVLRRLIIRTLLVKPLWSLAYFLILLKNFLINPDQITLIKLLLNKHTIHLLLNQLVQLILNTGRTGIFVTEFQNDLVLQLQPLLHLPEHEVLLFHCRHL